MLSAITAHSPVAAVRLILRLVGDLRDRAVLDVGCGDGTLISAMWRNGAASVVGCNADPRMIAAARSRAVRDCSPSAYAVARAEQLPFRDASFDIATIVTVLVFVLAPERSTMPVLHFER